MPPLSQTSALDGVGSEIVAGEGVAGTPAGGVLTVQGIVGGTPQPISAITALSPSSPTTFSVAVTSSTAVAFNASRKGLVLTNLSSGRMSFGLGVAAVAGSGIVLLPGGVWVMDQFTFSTASINAISTVASSVLSVQEFS